MTETQTTDTQTQAGTRDALLEAAQYLFGHKGYEGTSTRAIADRAGVNVASIAYHFGGKAGLRRACAEELAERLNAVLQAEGPRPLPDTPQAAVAEMETAIRAITGIIVGSDGARDTVAFILRELGDPGEAAELIFARLFLPRHARFCQLWSIATGQPAEADEVKLTIFSLIGQIVYFRIAEPFVARRMGWSATGPDQAAQIADLIIGNLNAMIERARR